MKLLKIVLLAVALTGGATAIKAQTPDEIIQKHIEAMGGTEKWNSIKSMKLTGTMNMGGLEMEMTQTVLSDVAMRMDFSVMGQSGYTIITPKEGWMSIPGTATVTSLPPDQVKASHDKLNIKNGYLIDRSKIKIASYLGKDTITKIPCYKLKVTDNDGSEQIAYIDLSTYFLVRSELKVKIKDEDQEVAVTYSNFKKLPEGIVVAMSMNAQMGDVNFNNIEVNQRVDESIFKPCN
jgi:outer membrane lipoprotein-sorting protein